MSFTGIGTGEWIEKVASKELSLVPKGYQQIMVGTTAVGLTPPANTFYALIEVATNLVRYRDDGPNPTGTQGVHLAEDSHLWYTGNLATFKMIRDAASAGDAEVNVLYYG